MSRKITEEEKNRALESYAKYGNLTAAAQYAGTNRMTLWREKTRNKAFKTAMDNALEEYYDKWDLILESQATKNPLLLMFKMKADRPDKYRERIDHKVDTNIKIITGIPRPPKVEEGQQGERPPLTVTSSSQKRLDVPNEDDCTIN